MRNQRDVNEVASRETRNFVNNSVLFSESEPPRAKHSNNPNLIKVTTYKHDLAIVSESCDG
jgi:hypothetical protein